AAVLRWNQRAAPRDEPRRHGPRARRVRPRRALRRAGWLRHARAAHGAWLPARELPFAAHQPAYRRLWRRRRQAPSFPARGARGSARGLARGQTAFGAPLLERLGAGWPRRGPADRDRARDEGGG